MSEISMGRSRLYVGLAALTAILYDVLFWKDSAGVNFLLLVVVSTLLVTIGLAASGRLKNTAAFGVAFLALAFAGSVATYENEFVTWIAPVVAVLLSLVYVGWVSMVTNGLPVYLHQFAFVRHFDEVFSSWKTTLHALASGREGIVRHILWGLVIAAPLVIIFGLLFSAADPIFADWLKRLNVWESAWRVVRTIVLALLGAGGLYVLTHEKNAATPTTPWHWRMAVPTVVVVLVLLNLLFAAFVAIQIKYFFGGASYVLATGLTFADYARNGFFELARVLVIAAIIILFIHRSFAATRNWWVAIFQVAFIAQVGVVAVSALKRMALYQEMYGFTTLRLYVAWFIYLVLAILVFSGIALLIRISFRRYALAVTFLGLVAGAVVAFINVDGVIANENITRWAKEDKNLDVQYLTTLSLDAVPAMAQLTSASALATLKTEQLLDLKKYWENSRARVASTTKFSITRSSVLAKFALSDEPVKAFAEAEARDKKYSDLENALGSNDYGINCEDTNWLSTSLHVLGSLKGCSSNVVSSSLPDGASYMAVIFESDQITHPTSTVYTYAIVHVTPQPFRAGNYKDDLPNYEIVYSRVLHEFTGEASALFRKNQGVTFRLQKNGGIIEADYLTRTHYLFELRVTSDPLFFLQEPKIL